MTGHRTITLNLWQVVLSLIGLFLFPLLLGLNVDFGFCVAIIIWYYAILYSISNGEKNIPLLMFLLMFYLFLLGSYVNDQVFHYSEGVVLFDKKITQHIYVCLCLSLVFLLIGNYCTGVFSHGRTSNNKSNYEYERIVSRVSLIFYYICYIPYIITEIYHALYSRSMGYTSLYLSEADSFPYIFRLIAYMCPVFFYIYLASLPTKKSARIPIFLYIIYCVVTLFSGQRSNFVINLIVLIIYLVFRNNNRGYDDSPDEKWIGRKFIIFLLVFAPIGIILLNIIGSVRFGEKITHSSFIDSILNAFNSQGVSISVIGYEKQYEQSIPNKIYSLGGLIELFKYNPISSALFGTQGYTGQTVARALNGNSFAHTISYFVLPWGYSHGRGLGSCFIAEAYHDFGYFGISIWSFIYGVIIKECGKFNDMGIWGRAVILYVLYNILMAPRAATDAFISGLLQIQVILAFIISLMFTNYYYNKRFNSAIAK